MADPREEALKALRSDLYAHCLCEATDPPPPPCLYCRAGHALSALRTGGQQEAVAWGLECDGEFDQVTYGTREAAEYAAKKIVEREQAFVIAIHPLVYGDTLGDSKGEG